jgi:hypothetical protein
MTACSTTKTVYALDRTRGAERVSGDSFGRCHGDRVRAEPGAAL